MQQRIRRRVPEVDAFEQHLLSVRGRRGQQRYTPRTARLYATTMNRALALGGPLEVLRQATSTALWLQAGNAALAWARWKGDKVLEAHVAEVPDPKVTTEETVVPPAEDWAKLVSIVQVSVPEPRRQVLIILLTSGLRVGDVLRLTRDQVFLIRTNRCLIVGQKGDHARKWRPSAEARAALLRLLEIPGWRLIRDIFDRHVADPLTDLQRQSAAYYEVRKTLLDTCATAGVDFIRFHRYRHGVAELAHARGAPLERIQEMLGHGDPRTTRDYYLHLEDDAQVELADGVVEDIKSGRRRP